jgi:S-adenosylmethionine decarboxylase
MRYLGRHFLAEFFDCDRTILDDVAAIRGRMRDAALAARATIVDAVFHRFNPHGVSGVVVIAESHLSIHTWPEYGYAAVDIFTCGDQCQPEDGLELLKGTLGSGRCEIRLVERGFADQVLGAGEETIDFVHKPAGC